MRAVSVASEKTLISESASDRCSIFVSLELMLVASFPLINSKLFRIDLKLSQYSDEQCEFVNSQQDGMRMVMHGNWID